MKRLTLSNFKKRNVETHNCICEIINLKLFADLVQTHDGSLSTICIIHEAREDGTYEEDPFANSSPSIFQGFSYYC